MYENIFAQIRYGANKRNLKESTIAAYCESMFPKKYGRVIDFIHVYQEELDTFGDAIEWLPEEEARIDGK